MVTSIVKQIFDETSFSSYENSWYIFHAYLITQHQDSSIVRFITLARWLQRKFPLKSNLRKCTIYFLHGYFQVLMKKLYLRISLNRFIISFNKLDMLHNTTYTWFLTMLPKYIYHLPLLKIKDRSCYLRKHLHYNNIIGLILWFGKLHCQYLLL